MARNNPRRRKNGKKLSAAKLALQKGIVPIRRCVNPASYEVLSKARKGLYSELQGGARFYQSRDVAVTVIGFTRLNTGELNEAPKTADVIKDVESCSRTLEVRLGGLALFGGNRYKLGFHVDAAEIHEEAAELEAVYSQRGFSLLPCAPPGSEDGSYNPHCTIGNLYTQSASHFEDRRAQKHYDRIAEVMGSVITLDPVQLPSLQKRN